MEAETIKCDIHDSIALVTIDRPPVNAVNTQFHNDMMQVFGTLGDRDDVR